MPIQTFGQWIKEQMKVHRLKGIECADRAGVKPQVWSEWANDRTRRKNDEPRRITPETIDKIAAGLQMNNKEVARAVTLYKSVEYVTELTSQASATGNRESILDYYHDLPPVQKAAIDEIIEAVWLKDQDHSSVSMEELHTLPASQLRWDMEKHKLYTHDGQLADDKTRLKFFADVTAQIIADDVENIQDEIRVLNKLGL